MQIEDRIRRYLEEATSGHEPADRLDQVMAEGRRRRVRQRLTEWTTMAAAILAVVVVGTQFIGRYPQPPVATTVPPKTATVPVAPDLGPAGAIIAGPEGISITDRQGNVNTALVSDPAYQAINWAASDLAGGLVYQHTTTPLAWPEGSILHLPAQAGESQILVEAEPEPGSWLRPVGLTVDADGSRFFVYQEESLARGAVMTALNLTSGESTEFTLELPGSDASVSGGVILIPSSDETGCTTLSLFTVNGETAPSPFDECLPMLRSAAIGSGGEDLALIDDAGLSIVSIATGEELASYDIEAFGVTSGPGGWVARGTDQSWLVDLEGIEPIPPITDGWVAPYTTLDLAPDATLGSGSADLPCQPSDLTLEPQDLPDVVAATRQTLFEAAVSCDYETLAGIVSRDGTTTGFGTSPAPDLWIEAARNGQDPLLTLAWLLNTRPAASDGVWSWPAVHVDPADEESWAELDSVFPADVIDQLRRFPDSYLGYRVGITDDGTWQFFVAGD